MEKYQITKTIRFKLEAGNAPELEEQVTKLGNEKEAEASLTNLITIGQDLSNLLKNYIYADKQKLKKTVTVHWRWLREFTKDKYFEWKNTNQFEKSEDNKENPQQNKNISGSMASQLKGMFPQSKKEDRKENKNAKTKEKRFKLSDVSYLNATFETFTNYWDVILQNLVREVFREKELLTRKAEIGKMIYRIGTRDYLPFLEKFIEEANDKDDENQKEKLKKTIVLFKENLSKAEQWTLPAQSSGIELAKASFNYYTINKKEKDFEKEIRETKKELSVDSLFFKKEDLDFLKRGKFLKEEFNQATKEKKNIFLYEFKESGELQQTEKGKPITLETLYPILKVFKATQKKFFQEVVSQGVPYEEAIEKYFLFSSEDKNSEDYNRKTFQIYKEFTEKIKRKGDEINKTSKDSPRYKNLKEEVSKLRQQRGKLFFQGPSKRDEPLERFAKYLKFCKIYKDIAMKRGRLIARCKGIEKEKIDSKRLKYWSFLIEKENQHELILVPKNNAQEAYRKITSLGEANTDLIVLYYFESLTYRALRKLCFGVNGNTFIPEIKEELKKKNKWQYEERDFGEHVFKIKNGQEEIRDEKKLISFYKDVLQTDYVRKNREDGKLVLPSNFEEEVLKPDFDTEEKFKTALEKCCYLRKKVFPKTELEKILSDCNAQRFFITNYDLRKKDKGNLKAHTKLWLKFWDVENETQKFPLRLNPEIKILWREPKATRVDKYGEGTELYDKDKKNRYLHPQFTLTTSFLENALTPEINFSFQDVKTEEAEIDKFNKETKKFLQDKNELWLYGIDTGEVELATLCLIKKDLSLQYFEVLEFKEDKLDFEKTGFLKDGTPKQYKAIQNLSYFLNEELYKRTFKDDKFQEVLKEIFEKKNVPALDLSISKLINGYIVSNGDISAKLNLNLSNARRKIVDRLISNSAVKIEFLDEMPDPQDSFKIKVEGETIFHGNKIYNSIKNWETIKSILKESFEKDKENSGRVQEDIFNYRKNISANMIGVIHHLYQKFPGILSLEFLGLSEVESHRSKFHGMIENPIEHALNRKFQTIGLVPPIKEVWKIKTADKQIGIIYFPDSKSKCDIKDGKSVKVNGKGEPSFAHGLRCPSCCKKAYKDSSDDDYNKDKGNKIFQCKHCSYHNKQNPMDLQGLDSNDKVAAYNIAKRGLEILN